jgi:hypothetical protein
MTESPPTDQPPKSTLFCPCCDHQSDVDGDWVLVDAVGRTRYVCPACENAITVRPEFDADDDDAPSPMMAWVRCCRAWGRTLSAWQRVPGTIVTDT